MLSTIGSCPADTEDITEHTRRATKTEEQVVRSARNVYSLNQQVTQFQDELGRVNLRSVDESKKVFDLCCFNSVHLSFFHWRSLLVWLTTLPSLCCVFF